MTALLASVAQIMLAATVGVVLRERKLGRLPAIPDKPKPGEAHDWRFKCSLCRQRSAVVCSYAYHDVLPIVCSCSCVGLVVSACITSIATYGQSSATLIVKVRASWLCVCLCVCELACA